MKESSDTKLPYTHLQRTRSNRKQRFNDNYVGPVPIMDNILNRFVVPAATSQWIIRYILLFTVFWGMSCIIMSIRITPPPRINLHRLKWSKYGPKPIKSNPGHPNIIDAGVTTHSNQSLKYRLTTIAAVSNSRSRHTKTQYPVTLDAPYLLSNPNLCKSVANLSALVIVHTAPDHFVKRDIMRKTWTNNSYFHHLGSLRILFLLGTVLENSTQKKIENEFKKHQDLVQGNFLDTYRNLTHKGVMGYKWISENCMNAQIIVKTDDDVVVDVYKLLSEYIPKLSGRKRYILCNRIDSGTMPIIREKKNKWYVDSDLFRGHKFYPPYCSGFGVIISTNIIPFIYRAAYLTPFFWVDDVYLYGMLPSKVKDILYISLSKNVSLNFTTSMECFENKTKICPILIYGGAKPEDVVKVWNAMGKAYERTSKITLILSNTSSGNGDKNRKIDKGQGKNDSDKNQMPKRANIQIKKEGAKASIKDDVKIAPIKTDVARPKANSTKALEKDSKNKETKNKNRNTTDAGSNKLGNRMDGNQAHNL